MSNIINQTYSFCRRCTQRKSYSMHGAACSHPYIYVGAITMAALCLLLCGMILKSLVGEG